MDHYMPVQPKPKRSDSRLRVKRMLAGLPVRPWVSLVLCPSCHGWGCKSCHGRGKVTVPTDG